MVMLVHFGVGTSDNAASTALLETKRTFEKILDKAKTQGFNNQSVVSHKWIGSKRSRNIDLFYIDNLVVPHASNEAFGETKRDEHSEGQVKIDSLYLLVDLL